MHRDRWHELRGYDENMRYWGWSDSDLALRMRLKYSCLDMTSVTDAFCVYHLAHPPIDKKGGRLNIPVFNKLRVNGSDWGLGSQTFPEFPVSPNGMVGSEQIKLGYNHFEFHVLKHLFNILVFAINNIDSKESIQEAKSALRHLMTTVIRKAIPTVFGQRIQKV